MERRRFIAGVLALTGASAFNVPLLRASTSLRGQSLPADPWKWSATQTRSAIVARQISCREVVDAHLARYAVVNPVVNAIVDFAPEEAIASATLADQMLAQGFEPGRLFGVPMTVKDNTDLKGHRTVNGLASASAEAATDDSPVVRSLRSAGAIIIGKTNTPCLSSRWETDNSVYGRTVNPWSRERTPGGSSGGAAAALASGMGALAHGNDIGGSIRYPAYCCGVTGLRPSMGRTPMFNGSYRNDRSFCNQMFNVEGMLARNVEDLLLSLPAISEGDARDPAWNGVPSQTGLPGPQRVGIIMESPGLYVSQPVKDALTETARRLADRGFQVEEVTPPVIEEAVELWARMVFSELRAAWPGFSQIADEGARKANQFFLDLAPTLSIDDYVAGTAAVMAMRRRWSEFMERWPILIGPNSGDLPFMSGFDIVSADDTRHQIASQALMVTVNLLGLPSVAVPTAFVNAADAPNGLPTGVQVIARRFADEDALMVAEVIQTAFPQSTITDPVKG
ncbi:amidase [Rhizobium subbaraonis]|uniref:Indoleacetamide hydrolase n=1 Tax=Rhizobium subbaraonis TaxID=908946 RepID=A0A285UW35_9HYPH|nr:amidase [Rhizobium subbaraonis]SOC45993.1 amidase [Rhizobium subbaraonis]